jgi:phospholipid/cholesterol/gamma-HCH transport system substrate-binding protein
LESKTNYTFVGLVVLLLIAGLIAAGLWLSIGFERKVYNLYTVYMRESVSGLSEESLVKFNGVRVGLVYRIELSQFDPRQVKITLKVEEGTPITTSTHATLITQGITGTTYLGLTADTSTFLPLQRSPGEPYPVIPTKPSFFSQLEKNINDVSKGFKRMLTEENAENLKKSLANIEHVTEVISRNSSSIQRALQDFPRALSKFKKMADSISTAGEQVSTTMKAGKTGIDKISQQALPPAINVLHKLEIISANLEKVSAQMRRNPSVLLRGTSAPKPGPGE